MKASSSTHQKPLTKMMYGTRTSEKAASSRLPFRIAISVGLVTTEYPTKNDPSLERPWVCAPVARGCVVQPSRHLFRSTRAPASETPRHTRLWKSARKGQKFGEPVELSSTPDFETNS